MFSHNLLKVKNNLKSKVLLDHRDTLYVRERQHSRVVNYSYCLCECVCVRARVSARADVQAHAQSYPILCDPMGCAACQAPLSMELSRQEYWNGLRFHTPGNLSDPGRNSCLCVSCTGRQTLYQCRSPNVGFLVY